MEMRVLVTGGLGFVGSSAARACVMAGHRVTIVDHRLSDHGANDRNIATVRDNVHVVEMDVRNEEGLSPLVRDSDVVVHAAGHVSHTHGLRDPSLDIEHNVRATLAVARLCAETGARLVFTSTRGVYGRPVRLPVDEIHPCAPLGPHEWSKLAAEEAIRTIGRLRSLRFTILRISNVYGPGAQLRHAHSGVINYFVGRAIQDEGIPIFGDGSARRDVVYVDDVGQAIVRSAVNDAAVGETFNVGSAEMHSFAELAELIVQVAGTGRVTYEPYSAARGAMEVGDFAASVDRMSAKLDWRPTTTLRDGLVATITYYREHLRDYLG